MSRRLGGAQSRYGRFGEEIYLLRLPEMKMRFVHRPASSQITKLTELCGSQI